MKKHCLFLLSTLMLLCVTSCHVDASHTEEPALNIENGHEYVDLGLSVKWATMNIGADKPADFGRYFAWGETVSKETYTEDNYTYKPTFKTLPLLDDAARINWGGKWRMPSPDEINELIENCNWTYTWTSELNLYGYMVTSKINGKSIFLPSAEVYTDQLSDGTLYGYGAYWSNSAFFPDGFNYISALYFYQGHVDIGPFGKYVGMPIRPVLPVSDDVMVKLEANGGKGSMEPIKVAYAEPTKLPSPTFVKEGYDFLGWDTKADGTGQGYGATSLISATSDVTLYAQWLKIDTSGKEGNYDYVDLGLPSGTKWAIVNVGAKTRWDSGAPYAWGETGTKANYTEANYTYKDRPTTLPLAHDAAHVNWGGAWRMPTAGDFKELMDNCTFTPLDKYDQQGYVVSSNINGKVLYFAAIAAYQGLDSIESSERFYGNYSSSSYDKEIGYPYELYMHPYDYDLGPLWELHRGSQIRAVFK